MNKQREVVSSVTIIRGNVKSKLSEQTYIKFPRYKFITTDSDVYGSSLSILLQV